VVDAGVNEDSRFSKPCAERGGSEYPGSVVGSCSLPGAGGVGSSDTREVVEVLRGTGLGDEGGECEEESKSKGLDPRSSGCRIEESNEFIESLSQAEKVL